MGSDKKYKIDKITRKFYNSYKRIHDKFKNSIEGIEDETNKEWYTSVMLNRLMFTYFVQKKGFLDNDFDYLRNHLEHHKKESSYSFYNNFIVDLFHKGLSIPKSERNKKIEEKIGDVPYLNGGLFNIHYLEQQYNNICINNDIFEEVFTFFEKYEWFLDERPLDKNNEITPEIIGYIFEKYINRKEKGAYYTEKDTTDYISKYTIIPYILYKLKEKFPNEFNKGGLIWNLLKDNLDRYIYSSIKKGIKHKLPSEIEEGLDDYTKRNIWNNNADIKYGFSTELWREVIQRRNIYKKIHKKANDNQINIVRDLITYNLNVEKLMQDIIENGDYKLIKELYLIIAGDNKKRLPISILDPTCGSGAFLFSALNILEVIYENCISRMRDLVLEEPNKYIEFENILSEIDSHNNTKYYIYKSIILKNLYGVDIMSEAVEITKLRLLLKLLSLVEDYDKIEPLPDIDFNIISGNTLVGFAKKEDVFKLSSENLKLQFNKQIKKLRELKKNTTEFTKKKKKLIMELNKLLAKEYKIIDEQGLQDWISNYKPFHWFAEFNDIMNNGGFDCIIGNPPYVEYYQVRKSLYTIKDFKTEKCGNLSAFVTERSYEILKDNGHLGFITPISIVSTPRMSDLRELITNNSVYTYFSTFGDRPGTLFNGVHQKLSIILSKKKQITDKKIEPKLFTTNYYHWYSNKDYNERKYLFDKLCYVSNDYLDYGKECILKIGDETGKSIWEKLQNKQKSLYEIINKKDTRNSIYLSMRMTFWTKCFLRPKKSNEFKVFNLDNDLDAKVIMAVLNSNTFFYFWEIVSDCWHITNKELKLFKLDLDQINNEDKEELYKLALKLEEDLEKNKGYVGTVQTDYEYYHKKSKNIIDKIDHVLAIHYGFTEEELDYIINYNIKYRMSNEL